MALNVISNFAANVAHRNLTVNDRMTTSSLAKLSSGSRIVSAKDDAASLAIGSRLNAEVQAQKTARVNTIQATSMLQIADGAMAKISDILVRMKTLAVQAGSGQLGSTERGFLDTEYQALISEIDRIASDTEFNSVTLINGSSTTSTNLNAQVSTDNYIEAADGFASIELGSSVGAAAFTASFDAATDVLTLTNLTTGTSQGINVGSTAIAANATQTVNFDQLDVVITLNSAFDKTTDIKPTGVFTLGGAGTGAIENSSISVTAADAVSAVYGLTANVATLDTTAAATSTLTLGTFTSATVDLTSTGTKTFVLSDGTNDFTVSLNVTTAFANSATTSQVEINDLGSIFVGSTTAANTTSFTYKLGTGSTANVDDLTISVSAASVSALALTGTDITDATNANTASTAVTTAINTLNTARAGVGAALSRLEFASDNLSATIENSEAARSNLMDLDVAAEMTVFTSKQILVQVGVSMLAQANQLPQNLLQLFQ